MKIFSLLILICILISGNNLLNKDIVLEINKSENEFSKKEALKILIASIDPINTNSELNLICEQISKFLDSTSQFKCDIKNFEQPKNKKEITSFFNLGYPVVIFIASCDNATAYEWRLYDTTEGIMVKGKKYIKQCNNQLNWATSITNQIIEALTGKLGSFGTKLAYIKRIKKSLGKQQYIICSCDLDGTNEKVLVKQPGMYVGLYWHNKDLFCSEFTKYNVRLIKINESGQKKTILDLKGNCVGISLSDDFNNAVYCKSGDIYLYNFDPICAKSSNEVIITNDGKNVSPILLPTGDIIFCSDSKKIRKKFSKATGPQICLYNRLVRETELITTDGYCVGPTYNKLTNKIVYSKKVKGVMQLFMTDLHSKKHEQLTFDEGNKIDSFFSPCGNYVVFCFQNKNNSSIGIFNLILKSWSLITNSDQFCMCPTWSRY